MNIIISIKPKYVSSIIAGNKKVEFRKIFPNQTIDKCYIYSSSPCKKIIGYFTVKKVERAQPLEIWQSYNDIGGINEFDFFNYYMSSKVAVCIVFEQFFKFDTYIDPRQVIANFVSPQSYMFTTYDF